MSQLQEEQDQGVVATHVLKEGQAHKMLATASAVLKKHLCQPTAVASAKEQPHQGRLSFYHYQAAQGQSPDVSGIGLA